MRFTRIVPKFSIIYFFALFCSDSLMHGGNPIKEIILKKSAFVFISLQNLNSDRNITTIQYKLKCCIVRKLILLFFCFIGLTPPRRRYLLLTPDGWSFILTIRSENGSLLFYSRKFRNILLKKVMSKLSQLLNLTHRKSASQKFSVVYAKNCRNLLLPISSQLHSS